MRQAVILAAGRGKRMEPLTLDTPKTLLMVRGKTILERTFQALPDEIAEAIVVVGYLKEQIKNFLGDSFAGRKILYVEDDQMRGTGFAVSLCKDLVRNNFLVVNGDDLYSKTDLSKLLGHEQAMLCVRKPLTSETQRFGRILADQRGRMIGIGADSEWINAGAYVLSPKYFDFPLAQLPSGEYGLPQTMVNMAAAGLAIDIVEAGFWVPIGFPEDIKKAEQAIHE